MKSLLTKLIGSAAWVKSSLAVTTSIFFGTLGFGIMVAPPAQASVFQHQEVDQSRYVAIAMPLASGYYRLIVVNQITNARPCWSESGANPTIIEPLLVTFDFTGICARGTDSNGYSIRVAGQDLGIRYSLLLEQRDGEMWLVGRENGNSAAPPMLIGRTNGMANGFKKINLLPSWRFARRTFNNKVLGHIYFTNDSMATAITPPGLATPVTGVVPALPNPIPNPRPIAPISPRVPAAPTPAAPGISIPVPRPGAALPPTTPSLPPNSGMAPGAVPILVPRPGTFAPTTPTVIPVTVPAASVRPVPPVAPARPVQPGVPTEPIPVNIPGNLPLSLPIRPR